MLNEKDIDEDTFKIMEKLLDLTNNYIETFIETIDPKKYHGRKELFTHMVITPPSIIAASILNKLSLVCDINRKEILDQYIEKLKLSLRWVDHKNKG